MKSYCKRVGIPLLILTLLVSVMAPLITLAEDPPANSLALSIARA